MKHFLQNRKRGASYIYIIIIVALIAFLLAGGEFMLKNFLPLPGLPGSEDKESSTPSQNPFTNWSITLEDKGCDTATGKAIYALGIIGPKPGYFTIEVKSGDEYLLNYAQLYTDTPNSAYALDLPGNQGFRDNPWRVQLFEANPNSAESISGGTIKATQEAQATGC